MDASRCLELHYLRREVLGACTRGRVVIEFADGAGAVTLHEARTLADGMVSIVNLPMLGPHWFQVDADRAATIITSVLHWDLETLTMRSPESEAKALTGKILAKFSERSIYLTNVRASADISKSPHRWASGSDQLELDAGVAMVGEDLVGLLWVEDRP